MIEIKDLTKKFGDFTAVDHLNLRIDTGEFFGLLGPNGAGKTTTISMISTVLLPNSGEILVDGKPLTRKSSEIKRRISVITQEYSMRMDMTCDEVMEYQGRLYYMPIAEIRKKTDELLEFVGLKDFRKRTVRNLSGGMKRRLMICRALLTDPEIILLDEPTAGLDPESHEELIDMVKRVHKARGGIIIFVSHNMADIASLCDRVVVMDRGQIVSVDTPKEIFARRSMLASISLDVPPVTDFMYMLKDRGFDVDTSILDADEAVSAITRCLGYYEGGDSDA